MQRGEGSGREIVKDRREILKEERERRKRRKRRKRRERQRFKRRT